MSFAKYHLESIYLVLKIIVNWKHIEANVIYIKDNYYRENSIIMMILVTWYGKEEILQNIIRNHLKSVNFLQYKWLLKERNAWGHFTYPVLQQKLLVSCNSNRKKPFPLEDEIGIYVIQSLRYKRLCLPTDWFLELRTTNFNIIA